MVKKPRAYNIGAGPVLKVVNETETLAPNQEGFY